MCSHETWLLRSGVRLLSGFTAEAFQGLAHLWSNIPGIFTCSRQRRSKYLEIISVYPARASVILTLHHSGAQQLSTILIICLTRRLSSSLSSTGYLTKYLKFWPHLASSLASKKWGWINKWIFRLGMFGFLSTETKDAPGNYGMLDQVQLCQHGFLHTNHKINQSSASW